MNTIALASRRIVASLALAAAAASGCSPSTSFQALTTEQLDDRSALHVIRPDTTPDSLAEYCDTTELSKTFVRDPELGIGWGAPATHSETNPDGYNPVPHQMQCCRITGLGRITHVRARIKTRIDAEERSRGYLYISRPQEKASIWGEYWTGLSTTGVLSSFDAWGRDAWGKNSVMNHVTGEVLVDRSVAESKDVVVDVDYDSDSLEICMGGDTAPAIYSPRFISELSITTGR